MGARLHAAVRHALPPLRNFGSDGCALRAGRADASSSAYKQHKKRDMHSKRVHCVAWTASCAPVRAHACVCNHLTIGIVLHNVVRVSARAHERAGAYECIDAQMCMHTCVRVHVPMNMRTRQVVASAYVRVALAGRALRARAVICTLLRACLLCFVRVRP
eukprot:6194963-Pleurochrysis_carterae.AAC.4